MKSVPKRPRADILPVRSRASLVNKRFIIRLKKALKVFHKVRDHSGQCPVQYSENIGPAIEHFDLIVDYQNKRKKLGFGLKYTFSQYLLPTILYTRI